MNWLIENTIREHDVYHGGNIGVFRLAFSLSILIKFAVETKRGHQYYFDDKRYLSLLHHIRKPGDWWLTQTVWRILYILKVPATVFLFLGIFCKLSLLVLIASLLVELRIYFKYHSNFMLLVCIGLLWSNSLDSVVNARNLLESESWVSLVVSSFRTKEYLIVPCWMMMTLFAMYWFTALHKCNSTFLSGRVVATTLYTIVAEKSSRKFIDFKLPDGLIRHLITKSGSPKRLLTFLMYLVVIAEFAIPLGFMFEATLDYSVAIGIALHVCFLVLLPTTLLDFSLATISTYIVFIPPDRLSQLLGC